MSKNITDLRSILFDAIEGVKAGKLDLDKAKTINELSRTLVDTARAEIDHVKIAGGIGSDFLANQTQRPALPGETRREATGNGVKTITQMPGATITQHKMRG
jgi:hypothetical protein